MLLGGEAVEVDSVSFRGVDMGAGDSIATVVLFDTKQEDYELVAHFVVTEEEARAALGFFESLDPPRGWIRLERALFSGGYNESAIARNLARLELASKNRLRVINCKGSGF